jgi:hypothetical protein
MVKGKEMNVCRTFDVNVIPKYRTAHSIRLTYDVNGIPTYRVNLRYPYFRNCHPPHITPHDDMMKEIEKLHKLRSWKGVVEWESGKKCLKLREEGTAGSVRLLCRHIYLWRYSKRLAFKRISEERERKRLKRKEAKQRRMDKRKQW